MKGVLDRLDPILIILIVLLACWAGLQLYGSLS